MEEIGLRTFAVLIDADMVPAEFATPALAALGEWGQLAIKRAYADWSSPNRDSWMGELGRYAIQPMPKKEHSPGRHSDTRAMVIHALELHCAAIVDGVAIICGDDAFTPLATRLRESGAVVLGAGGTGVSVCFHRRLRPLPRPRQPDVRDERTSHCPGESLHGHGALGLTGA